jgi:hypothetical protein
MTIETNHRPVSELCGPLIPSLNPPSLRLRPVHTIELTDDELRLVRSALHSYLEDFGHEEADVLRAIKEVLAKLPSPE